VKKLIDEGRIGRVVAVAAVHSSSPPGPENIRAKSELGGGPLADKGCYCVNIARFFVGGEPTGVFARGDFDQDGLDRRVTADLEFQGGATAWMDSSHKLAGESYYQSCEIFGEKGRIYIPLPFAQRPTTEQGEIVDTSFVVCNDESVVSLEEKVNVKGVHQWQFEVEYFADRILKSEPIGFPMEDGLTQTQAMDAIYKSAREGRPEAL
jgi:predicted dehydrogenase